MCKYRVLFFFIDVWNINLMCVGTRYVFVEYCNLIVCYRFVVYIVCGDRCGASGSFVWGDTC